MTMNLIWMVMNSSHPGLPHLLLGHCWSSKIHEGEFIIYYIRVKSYSHQDRLIRLTWRGFLNIKKSFYKLKKKKIWWAVRCDGWIVKMMWELIRGGNCWDGHGRRSVILITEEGSRVICHEYGNKSWLFFFFRFVSKL